MVINSPRLEKEGVLENQSTFGRTWSKQTIDDDVLFVGLVGMKTCVRCVVPTLKAAKKVMVYETRRDNAGRDPSCFGGQPVCGYNQ